MRYTKYTFLLDWLLCLQVGLEERRQALMLIVLRYAYHGKLFQGQLSNLRLLYSYYTVGNTLLFDHALLETFIGHEESDLFSFEKDVQLINDGQEKLQWLRLVRHEVRPHRSETI